MKHRSAVHSMQISRQDEAIHSLEIERLHLQEEMTKYKEEVTEYYVFDSWKKVYVLSFRYSGVVPLDKSKRTMYC